MPTVVTANPYVSDPGSSTGSMVGGMLGAVGGKKYMPALMNNLMGGDAAPKPGNPVYDDEAHGKMMGGQPGGPEAPAQDTGKKAGSFLGGLAGTYGGPLGSLAGAAAGGLVGGLFDKEPEVKNQMSIQTTPRKPTPTYGSGIKEF